MKKIITVIIACILTLTSAAGLTGCTGGGDSSQKEAVCFVIANTANSQGLNMSSPLVQNKVYSTIRNYGYISVISVDASPSLAAANSYDIDAKYKGASKEKLDSDAKKKSEQLISVMNSVVADDEETDYYAALNLALRSLSSLEGYDSKSIIVLGTGLSTSGVLNFQNKLLFAEPDAIVERLKENEEILNFNGISVYWQQLADVAVPQETLTAKQKNNLMNIYKAIVEAGGGTIEFSDIMPNPVNTEIEYPWVTPIETGFKEPLVLTENEVLFIGDKAEYLYPDAVINALKPIADYLIDSQVSVLLCGTTAGDENSEFDYNLSLSRAEAVRNSLIELDVDSEQIIAVGMASDNPWHIYGAGYEGEDASSNRSVVILDASTELAKSILEEVKY